MSRGTLDPAVPLKISRTGFSPSTTGLPRPFRYPSGSLVQSVTPKRSRFGLGSSAFARRYSRNRCFFLFLRLLRCFSSAGSPPCTMDSCMDAWGVPTRVSPFRHPRIDGYLLLPGAFRSLSRLSSAPSAKASAPRLIRLTSPACIALHAGGRLLLLICCLFLLVAAHFRMRHLDVLIMLGLSLFFSMQFSRCVHSFRRGSRGPGGSQYHPPGSVPSATDGLKWTRTTDLTLIRRAL